MLEKRYRHIYQRICINPVLKVISRKISPIFITILSGIIGILVVPALYFNMTLVAVGLILLSGYLDTLDGSVARYNNTTSDTGSALDIFTDRIVEGAIIIGLCLVDYHNRGFICLLMFFAILLCITAFLIVGIFTANNSHKGFFYSEGLIERAEAFIFFILMIILPEHFNVLGLIFSASVLITAFIHLGLFYKYSKSQV